MKSYFLFIYFCFLDIDFFSNKPIATMVTVKCIIYSNKFDNKEALLNHFVEFHNVPRSDTVLNRYANLRFSSKSNDMNASNLKIMLDLLKLLKRRAAKYTAERNKVRLDKPKIHKLFDAFINYDEHFVHNFAGEEPERLALLNWFLTYYNVYVNKDTAVLSNEENDRIASFYSKEERERIKCARIKVEQKDRMDLDFNDQTKIPHTGSSPYEIFIMLIKTLFFKIFSEVHTNENMCQIMYEITTEFVKSESSETEIYTFEENNDGTSDMYAECEEYRVVKDYSVSSSGHVLNIKRIFNEGISDLSRKVLNSFNVTGSNWSLRTIINMNVNFVFDFKSYSSISRLVKGRITSSRSFLSEHSTSHQIGSKEFPSYFEMCLQQLCMSREIRDKMSKMRKGQASHSSKTGLISELSPEDRQVISLFTETYFKIVNQPTVDDDNEKSLKRKKKKRRFTCLNDTSSDEEDFLSKKRKKKVRKYYTAAMILVK